MANEFIIKNGVITPRLYVGNYALPTLKGSEGDQLTVQGGDVVFAPFPGTLTYTFKLTVDASSNIISSGYATNVPIGWTITRVDANTITVTHNLNKFLKMGTSQALDSTGNFTYRILGMPGSHPTIVQSPSDLNNITIGSLTSTNTNVTGSGYLYINLFF